MAPQEESVQLPSLERCLNGDICLIPWRTAFLRLTDPKEVGEQEYIYYYFSHPETRRLLANPFSAFSKATPSSKSAFESKTAAINVAPAQDDRYSIEEIKTDALALSQEVGIDELAALRIVLLEWQSRPATQLLHGFADEEIASLHDAVGISNFRSTIGASQAADALASIGARKADTDRFLSSNAKKSRIFEIYLSERVYFMKVCHQFLSAASGYGTTRESAHSPSNVPNKQSPTWLERLATPVWEISRPKSGQPEQNTLVTNAIKFINEKLGQMERGSGYFKSEGGNSEIETLWLKTGLTEVIHAMQIMIVEIQADSNITSSATLLSWLELMVKYVFLEGLSQEAAVVGPLLEPLGAITASTTLALLKLSESLAFLRKSPTTPTDRPTPFFMDLSAITKINEVFVQLASAQIATASPALLAWGSILLNLRELAMESSDTREMKQSQLAIESFNTSGVTTTGGRQQESTLYEDLFDKCNVNTDDCEDVVDTIIRSAVDGSRVLSVVAILAQTFTSMAGVDSDQLTALLVQDLLLGLLRTSLELVGYLPEIMLAVLAVLSGTQKIYEASDKYDTHHTVDARRTFLRDPILMEQLLGAAKSRFPYEAVPFLQLCRILATCRDVDEEGLPLVFPHLENMGSYTQLLPSDFQSYQTIREDENANYIALLEPLQMQNFELRKMPSSSSGPSSALVSIDAFQLPMGTVGQIISETRPSVVLWHHEYSCLNFLGRWLNMGKHINEPNHEITAEVVGLLASLLSTATRHLGKAEAILVAQKILGEASDGLSRGEDIVSLVFDRLEDNLQVQNFRGVAEKSLDVIIGGLSFIEALVRVLPGRVWPYLNRSSLLGVKGENGLMGAIISAIEVPAGDFPFLLACVRVFDSLVEDAIAQAVTRKNPSESSGRFAASAADSGSGVPAHAMSRTLLVYGQIMTELYESSANWRFNLIEEKLHMNNSLAKSFANILYYVYGVDDNQEVTSKMTSVLSGLSSHLLKIFRSSTPDDLPFNPVLRIVMDGLDTPTSTVFLRPSSLWAEQIRATLQLATKLIQAGDLLELPPSLFEDQMFKATPTLIRLYASHETYRLPVITILDILIQQAAVRTAGEPPSLLGHLGPEASCHFLDILSNLDRPLNDPSLYSSIWNFLSTLVSKRQQWFAIFLLTGSSPRNSLGRKKDGRNLSARRGKASLTVALDLLADIDNTDPKIAISILNFVVRAQENFPWATTELQKHPTFFTSILAYVAHLSAGKEDTIERCEQLQIAALVADLAAVYLHFAEDARNTAFYQKLIPAIQWFSNNAVEVSAYNTSLHANLRKNFAARYRGCQLINFKRTGLSSRQLGRDYFYDLAVAEKLLDHDSAWNGKSGKGFADELARANVNLSLVEAQINLLQSWKFLATEHCSYFMSDREIQKSMATVVEKCLNANAQDLPAEPIYDHLTDVRVEFALILLQRLNDVQARGSEVFGLLFTAWDTMRSRQRNYETALANNDTGYFRSLLNVLFLALQFHARNALREDTHSPKNGRPLPSDAPTILEILDVIVAQGFRSLTTYLHDDPSKCCPKDFAILTAILQTCLRTRHVEQLYEAIVGKFIGNSTSAYASALFSWSDKFMINNDPVYGELSISFLAELSTIPAMAEHLAVEGVLTRLSTSPLMNYYRQEPAGYDPLDNTLPRPFAIWTDGVLPICLNLLFHVSRVAPEVAAFLNQFAPQLLRSSSLHFENKVSPTPSRPYAGRISLAMASEVQNLALISYILDTFRQAGPSMGIDVFEMEVLKWDRARVKEDLEELLGRRPALRSRIVATSEKEIALQEKSSKTSGESLLGEKIVKELQAALLCLGGGEGEVVEK